MAGFDPEISYSKLAKASLIIQQNGAILIGTNKDENFLVGRFKLPAGGSTVRWIKSSWRRSSTQTGWAASALANPTPGSSTSLPTSSKFKKTTVLWLVVFYYLGDSLKTDILFAINAGIHSCLLFTGVTSREHYEA